MMAIISGIPPTSKAKHGQPQAMASMMVFGKLS